MTDADRERREQAEAKYEQARAIGKGRGNLEDNPEYLARRRDDYSCWVAMWYALTDGAPVGEGWRRGFEVGYPYGYRFGLSEGVQLGYRDGHEAGVREERERTGDYIAAMERLYDVVMDCYVNHSRQGNFSGVDIMSNWRFTMSLDGDAHQPLYDALRQVRDMREQFATHPPAGSATPAEPGAVSGE